MSKLFPRGSFGACSAIQSVSFFVCLWRVRDDVQIHISVSFGTVSGTPRSWLNFWTCLRGLRGGYRICEAQEAAEFPWTRGEAHSDLLAFNLTCST